MCPHDTVTPANAHDVTRHSLSKCYYPQYVVKPIKDIWESTLMNTFYMWQPHTKWVFAVEGQRTVSKSAEVDKFQDIASCKKSRYETDYAVQLQAYLIHKKVMIREGQFLYSHIL